MSARNRTCPVDASPAEREKSERERIERRCYQAGAIVRLVAGDLTAISGDEDAVDLAVESADWTSALDAAKEIMDDVAELVRQFKPASEVQL